MGRWVFRWGLKDGLEVENRVVHVADVERLLEKA